MMRRMALQVGCLAIVLAAGAAHADWPQFLGADRTNVAKDEKGLARQWPAAGPKVLWKVNLQVGFGGVAIHGDKVFVMDRIPRRQDIVRCLDLATGRQLWEHIWDAPGKGGGGFPGSRSTPATDGKHVFAVGTQGDVVALNAATGKLQWKYSMKDQGTRLPSWEVAQSALLFDGTVVVMPWNGKASVVALKSDTGDVKWATANSAGATLDYQSAVLMPLKGRMSIVAPSRSGGAIGVDAATGKQLWSYKGGHWRNQIVSPVVVDENRFFLTGGYNGGAAMVSLAGGAAKEVWKSKVTGPTMAQATLYEGHIYSPGLRKLTCIDLDGKVKWQARRGFGKEGGNMLIADGIIYVADDTTGDLVMVEAKPDAFKELGRAARALTPKKGKNALWGPPAISGGKLIWRDPAKLICFDVSE
jgi:outer membrane protein assembly factor BamB